MCTLTHQIHTRQVGIFPVFSPLNLASPCMLKGLHSAKLWLKKGKLYSSSLAVMSVANGEGTRKKKKPKNR